MKKVFILFSVFTIMVMFASHARPIHSSNRITEKGGAKAMESNVKKNKLPGVSEFSPSLAKKIEEMIKKRGTSYKPRTEHLLPDGSAKYINRLFLESSPYLLQHAHNPVNWYPWGEEAFDSARKLNRPVLVSIGYSTCHWCHVMEKESFEDEEIAEYINSNFIAIKVDREERPDIDSIYMAAVQSITGRGGWPLNVWLTPDQKPFYGGTYFPARDGDRGSVLGFLTILERINDAYHTKQTDIINSSQQIVEAINHILSSTESGNNPDYKIIQKAVSFYKKIYDPVYGGLKSAPKFPSSLPLRFLLRYYRRTDDKQVLDMIVNTLEKMAYGGIYDHIGGGFHRYSTDEKWLVPHFEKMLYDNALLSVAYIEGFQATGVEDFKRIATQILDYILKDMTSLDGAFYSATDADSLKPSGHWEEGYYFTWTHEEIEKTVGKEYAGIIKKYYNMGPAPNFEGRYILNTPVKVSDFISENKVTNKQFVKIIEESRELLYNKRNKRPLPLRDEKILSAWNGLMISAFAKAGFVFNEPEYTKIAVNAADFILEKLFINDRLYRSYNDKKARHNAYLSDYAFLVSSFLDLYESTFDPVWLKNAIKFDKILEEKYEDKKNGGFYLTSTDHEALIAREKPNHDGAVPSGNSVAALNLLRLYEFTLNEEFRKRSTMVLKAFLGENSSNHSALSEMLLALDYYLDSPREVIIVTPKNKIEEARPFLNEFRKTFIPNRVLTVVEEGDKLKRLSEIIPSLKSKQVIRGKATAYVCEKGICMLPAGDIKTFSDQINIIKSYTK